MKNLENEYKKSQQEAVPDLWNRIEAGLPPKKKKLPITKITPILGVCAAAVLCIMIVPGLLNRPQKEADLLMNAAPKADSSDGKSFAANEDINNSMSFAGPEMESALTDSGIEEDSDEFESTDEKLDSSSVILQEKMTLVELNTTKDNYTWKLQRESGDTILATVSEDITLVPEINTQYLFTLQINQGEEYFVTQVEELP